MELFLKAPYIVLLFSVVIATGFLSGVYISLYASRLSPLALFSPLSNSSRNKSIGKGVLITIQFMVFVFLCSATLLMEKQLLFSKNKKPGFDTNNVLVIRLDNQEVQKHFSVIKSSIENNPHVSQVAGSDGTPPTQSFLSLTLDGKDGDDLKEEGLFMGPGLISLLKIPILQGSDYTTDNKETERSGLIINQTAAKKYKVRAGEYIGSFFIRAVVADFNAHSLHRFIMPLLLIRLSDESVT